MRTADFRAKLAPNGQITVPPDVASQLPAGEKIQVILQWDASEDEAWRSAGRRVFESAYSKDDSVYELLADQDSHP